ncbi:MAG TPA: J domain-containing protein [Hyphomicrobiaceae bacterium]|nr:J domain-containing protein [Hyphomicrobiaceae bacterium]
MKLDSKYFDSIRIAQRKEETAAPASHTCQWKGCRSVGTHRAPMGRGRDGRYFQFCLDHVRQFNATYNYFEGMSDVEVEAFQRSAITGHRPTWKLGDNVPGTEGKAARAGWQRSPRSPFDAADPHEFVRSARARGATKEAPRRVLKPLERKALETMHLPETAPKEEIKARFKALVKRHHPDANGGDRGSEEKLREIIQAYNYLKQAGLV